MAKSKATGFRSMDWATFSLYLSLVAVGWLMVFTVGYGDGYTGGLNGFLSSAAGKQTIWIGISLFVFSIIFFLIDWKIWRTLSNLIYAFSIVLLIAVLFLGTTIKGATSWFSIGGFSFQPSEIAKFAACLAMANFLSSYNTSLRDFKSLATAFAIFLAPMGLILLQPDAGSALVFLSFLLVLFREGLSPNYFIIGGAAGGVFLLGLVYDPIVIVLSLILLSLLVLAFNVPIKTRVYWIGGALFVGAAIIYAYRIEDTGKFENYALAGGLLVLLVLSIFLWQKRKSRIVNAMGLVLILGSGISVAANYGFNNVLKPHQQDRINVWLRPGLCDPRGSLYNVIQSKMAISSGGLQGKGFLKGTMTKFNYVPEQSTDFIFCTIGEEQGFIGTFGIVALFLILLIRITLLAERQRTAFARHYAYCVVGILFIHFFINIGMTMGLTPIIGIPLPFISKGGSSLLGFTIMLAVLLKLDSYRYRL